MTELPCPLCSACASRILWRDATVLFGHCPSCRTCWVMVPSGLGRPDAIYDNSYYAANYQPYEAIQAAFFDQELKRLAAWPHPRCVMDVGFGTGVFLREAQRCGYAIHGVERSPTAQTLAVRSLGGQVPLHLGDLDGSSYPSHTFGLITFWDTLAHLGHPHAALAKAHDLLEHGGILVVKTPVRPLAFFKSFARWPAFLRNLRRSLIHFPMQIYYFDPDGLCRILEAVGFVVLEKRVEREPLTFSPKVPSVWEHPRGFLYFWVHRIYNALVPIRSCIVYARKKEVI